MEFEQVIETQKTELAAVAGETEPVPVVLTYRDIPQGIPLTNRLDKMNVEQAAWAIRNGDAWLVYLKANGGEVYEHTGASAVEVSPAEVYKAICDRLENVWLALVAENETLEPEQIPGWIDTLQWALQSLPVEYERQQEIIQNELDDWRGIIAY